MSARRGAAGGVAVLLFGLLAACAGPSASPSTSPAVTVTPSSAGASPTAAPTSLPPSATPSPTAAPTATPAIDVNPARPYAAADVLAAMRASRRPGGVPQALQTTGIASAIAAAVWTFDGGRWPEMVTGGSCGPSDCTLDVSGTPDGASGEDLYTFSVTPSSGAVKVLVADLHGYPAALQPRLDRLARAGVSPDRLKGLTLIAGRWLPPPDAGRFVLSYRSGGEEGSQALDVLLDASSGEVLEVRSPT